MRKSFVFALFLILPLAQGTHQPVSEGDIWRAAALDVGYARKFINTQLCIKDAQFKRACEGAIKKGLQFLLDRKVLTEALAAEWKSRPAAPDFAMWLARLDALAMPDDKSMLFGLMVNEYLNAFDAHAKIWPVAALTRLFGNANGEEVGPGFEVEVTGEGLFVRQVYDDTEAAALGVRAHDRIVYLNGESVGAGVQAQQVARHLRSEVGREVQLTLLQGEELVAVSLKLRSRMIPMVISSMIEVDRRKYAVMQVPVFRQGVCARAEIELRVLMEAKPHGLILDLRNNSGGRSDEARCFYRLLATQPLASSRQSLLNSLLPKDLDLRPHILSSPSDDDFLSPDQVFEQIPVAVLVTARSRSVTELLAAGLQDAQRAWLVGERTFGKGTFQLTQVLHFHTGLRLIHSVYQILRAKGVPIQKVGVQPNFEVAARADATALERQLLRESDLFPLAPEPLNSHTWQDPRRRRVIRLEACARKQARRTAIDYQQAFAAAVLRCDSKN